MRKILTALLLIIPSCLYAQKALTLEECRQMALSQNKDLVQQRAKLEMAGYDRKIAASYYYPRVSALGTYQHTGGGFSLVDDSSIPQFAGLGDRVQAIKAGVMQDIQGFLAGDPALAQQLMQNPGFQQAMAKLNNSDVAAAVGQIGSSVDKAIDDAIHPDLKNLYVGVISVQQPLFAGGKIIAGNKMARYAEQLARLEYDGNYDEVLVTVDQAYWQVVSVAAKKKLAESYSTLLHNMLANVEVAVQEGVSTEADALAIRVKSNEADISLTRATNGLKLAKMFLCKQIGLPLDSEISLKEEGVDVIPVPVAGERKDFDKVIADRSETQRLELASAIYKQKVNIARADMLPQVALTANYFVMNPNMNNGFKNEFGTNWSAGVLVSVPIFHGFEALNKTRKA
ncbi:MAG: TolC family protein, partial [Bacteroidales bacterium]|nr:TolC family protein [Bacteroidales bacterium]